MDTAHRWFRVNTMVEFEPNRAYGFLGNRISDDNLGTEGRKEGQTDREMLNYS